MDLKKSGVRKGNSRLQDSRLLGIVDKTIPESRIVKFDVPSNYQTRKSAATAELKKEYYRVQAITLICQASIR